MGLPRLHLAAHLAKHSERLSSSAARGPCGASLAKDHREQPGNIFGFSHQAQVSWVAGTVFLGLFSLAHTKFLESSWLQSNHKRSTWQVLYVNF